eukprot:TRINITY_DN9835_c0_g1_i3.p1 TRINITY_DN9835_c0_g1~~TRINITY_DN9835_c0_g1_i3.p1  ORF type:complete len:218 (+),score=37.41 TRINITY_DN9835_c0_g1_i3:51-704(+)
MQIGLSDDVDTHRNCATKPSSITLGPAEVAHLLELAEAGWEPSEVGSGTYVDGESERTSFANSVSSSTRTSYSCTLSPAQTPIVTRIEKRLSALVDMSVDVLEPLVLVRYKPGQFFKTHHDGRFRPKTVFIYLNDLEPDDAGETFFPRLGIKVAPRKGCAVMWSNVLGPGEEDLRLLHLGLPPKSGTKYGVNCFFNEKCMRTYVPVVVQRPAPAETA